MKIVWLSSFSVLVAAAVFAQPPAAQTAAPASNDTQMVSITGCVAEGARKGDPVTLTYAMVLPSGTPVVTANPSTPVDPTATPPVTEPPPPVSDPATQPQAVGTSGSIAGTAPAGSSASSVDGYRLSGVDMTSWIGQRVQLTGTVLRSARPAPAANPSKDSAAVTAMPEFRVTTVQPVTGPCIK